MVILASNSPRRREILSLLDIDFTVIPAKGEPKIDAKLPPERAVERIAEFKAESVAAENPEQTVIGADTAVLLDGEFLGKPKDENDAFEMLKKLSGKTHTVITAVCIASAGKSTCFSQSTRVTFGALSDEEIKEYIATGEPADKAGAYGIQGRGARFVKKIDGDFYTVMGLPCAELYRHLKALEII